MIDEINAEREKSDRLTVVKLNAVKQFNKQDYKSKLMTEKYSLLPLNSQQLTPVQTAIQRMSEKHLDFEIEPVNTIQPPEIEYTQTPQALVPMDTPLSIIRKHIPRQSDIDKIVRNIETRVIHSLEFRSRHKILQGPSARIKVEFVCLCLSLVPFISFAIAPKVSITLVMH